MRILLFSDNPASNSGYARHASWLASVYAKAGHEVVYYAHNYMGNTVKTEYGYLVGNVTGLGTTGLFTHYTQKYKPDIILTVKDAMFISTEVLKNLTVPWVVFAPVDTEPLSTVLKTRLQYASHIFCPTVKGCNEISDKLHYPVAYTPHYAEYKAPVENLRVRYKIPNDYAVYLIVGDNNEYPSRKNLDKMILAWHTFVATENPNAILFLHTNLTHPTGVNLKTMLENLETPAWSYRYTPQDQYMAGCDYQYLSDLYHMSDCLLQVSGGEGFSMTAIEAQAHNRPVLGVNFTALDETIRTGWLLHHNNVNHGDLDWHPWGGFRFRPHTLALVEYYKHIYAEYDNDGLQSYKSVAAANVVDYSEPIVRQLWLDALNSL